MAPLRHRDDDFVLTISDNDDGIPLSDEEASAAYGSSTEASLNSQKRKRDTEISLVSFGSNPDGQRKRTKSKSSVTLRIEETPANEEDHTWTAQGEDDGAIDSDFEFQISTIDNGIIEDFDGWGLSDGPNGATRHANNKSVDIDELISRRRKAGTVLEGGDCDTVKIMNGSGASNRTQERSKANTDSDIQGGEAKPDLDEGEELLAEDGFGMGATLQEEEGDEDEARSGDDISGHSSASDDGSTAAPVPHPDDQALDSSSDEERYNPAERARREAFFAPEEKNDKPTLRNSPPSSFQTMSLSRPILRGLASVGFAEPTPIQRKTIPIALLGKDVVGGAVTGSGKTAAFMIPILERLLYRPKKVPTSRVAVLMPTRELAVQCFNVAKKLASFTDVTFCQLVGGFSLREQESVLRSRPDVIVATPGRFIDHMRNSASFTVDTLEILVLDEADRMLEDGFADELNEILTTIPRSRQTMLFSATMTDNVDKLVRTGLNRPVRLIVNARKQTVGTLVQEFVRLRPGREDKRLAYLLHLCSTIYTDRVIIFFRQKKEAHRVRIIFGLLGFKVAELHGSMSQEQRITSVESFRSASVTHLLATDVASRGLDIKGVETVINYEAPQSHEIYLHRVGRTARAGRTGRSCTIAAEPDRKVVKMAVKSGKVQGAKIVSRVVDPALADMWAKKIQDMEEEVGEVLQEEKEEKQFGKAEMQVKKGENIMQHESEIMSRPKRTWFESEKEKMIAKKTGRAELNGPESILGEKKRLSGKDKKRLDASRDRAEGRVWKKGKSEKSGNRTASKAVRKNGKGGKSSKGDSRKGSRGR